MDNGGTEKGGMDTSAVQTARIFIFSPEPPTIIIGPSRPDLYEWPEARAEYVPLTAGKR